MTMKLRQLQQQFSVLTRFLNKTRIGLPNLQKNANDAMFIRASIQFEIVSKEDTKRL